jgi:hypothetical protein
MAYILKDLIRKVHHQLGLHFALLRKTNTGCRRNLELSMIIYYQKNSKIGPRIHLAVEEIYPKEMIVVCYSLEDAMAFPAFSPDSNNIFLFLAEDRKELSGFSTHLSHLLERKVILILPNMETETLSIGCTYHPRYMADMCGDLKDMQKVITKMTKKVTHNASRKKNPNINHPSRLVL